ncbi:MAG: ABC transporter ATP-binding protein [Alphaproteobacteria bacterium]
MTSPATSAIVEIDGFAKDYYLGSQVVSALRGVSLSVAAGEFIAIMGPSGSGKSTMLNLLGGLDVPSAGTYRLDGVDVAALGADALAEMRNGKIGFVFQSFNLLPRTTALANVELPLMYGRTPRDKRHARAVEVLKRVGLGERMDHHPSQLSGGQQQRVAIARALVNAPAIILADEPTGALDTHTGLEIMALFQELNRDGMTIIVVTHEPEIARFAHRQYHFRDGRIERIDENAAPPDARALLQKVPGTGTQTEVSA